jgi:DNA-binding CsgD family transcriptional regulator
VLSYGGFVNLKAQRLLAAREMATLCLEGAIRAANYELAVVACTQLNNIALDQNDGDLADLALDTMLSSSSRGGDLRMRGIALMNMYDRAGMRGDESELERLANPVSTYRETDPKTWSECVAPTLAMQSAWAGDFSSAVSVLIEAAAVEFDDSQRVLRLAEIALYASVGKEPRDLSDARAYLQEANDIMAVNEQLAGARIRRARLMMSIARGLLFDEPSGLALAKWLLTLTSTDEADLRLDGSNDARSKQLSDFDEFKSKEFLGWRRALSSAINARLRPAENPLTKTEQQIATLIASGHTSREVADILNRSVLTIETHVRSILRKLGSTNRRVAMRRARELGYI